TKLGYGGTGSHPPGQKKAPGPLVGTLESRYSKKVMDFQLDRRGFDSAPGHQHFLPTKCRWFDFRNQLPTSKIFLCARSGKYLSVERSSVTMLFVDAGWIVICMIALNSIKTRTAPYEERGSRSSRKN